MALGVLRSRRLRGELGDLWIPARTIARTRLSDPGRVPRRRQARISTRDSQGLGGAVEEALGSGPSSSAPLAGRPCHERAPYDVPGCLRALRALVLLFVYFRDEDQPRRANPRRAFIRAEGCVEVARLLRTLAHDGTLAQVEDPRWTPILFD